jgi:hypothetical protein
MPADQGLTAQLTVGEEESYGSRAADLTRGVRFISESLRAADPHDLDVGVNVGEYTSADAQRALQRRLSGGHLAFEIGPQRCGLFFKHMLGSDPEASPVITALGGDPGAYRHVYAPATLSGPGRSLTVQKGVIDPQSAGLQPVELRGCKVAAWQLDFAVGRAVNATLNMDARAVEDGARGFADAPSLAIADYALDAAPFALPPDASDPDVQGSAALLIDGVEVARVVAGRISCDNALTISTQLATDGLKPEPTPRADRAIYGQLLVAFATRAELLQAHFGGRPVALRLRCTGRAVSGDVRASLAITIPDVRFPRETPVQEFSPDSPATVPFLVLRPSDGGSDEPALGVEYVTTDAAC